MTRTWGGSVIGGDIVLELKKEEIDRRHYTYTIIYKHSIDNFDFVAIIKKKKKKWWKKKREEGKGKRSED